MAVEFALLHSRARVIVAGHHRIASHALSDLHRHTAHRANKASWNPIAPIVRHTFNHRRVPTAPVVGNHHHCAIVVEAVGSCLIACSVGQASSRHRASTANPASSHRCASRVANTLAHRESAINASHAGDCGQRAIGASQALPSRHVPDASRTLPNRIAIRVSVVAPAMIVRSVLRALHHRIVARVFKVAQVLIVCNVSQDFYRRRVLNVEWVCLHVIRTARRIELYWGC
jgi:hypothetical protein